MTLYCSNYELYTLLIVVKPLKTASLEYTSTRLRSLPYFFVWESVKWTCCYRYIAIDFLYHISFITYFIYLILPRNSVPSISRSQQMSFLSRNTTSCKITTAYIDTHTCQFDLISRTISNTSNRVSPEVFCNGSSSCPTTCTSKHDAI